MPTVSDNLMLNTNRHCRCHQSRFYLLGMILMIGAAWGIDCSSATNEARNNLSAMDTARIQIGEHTFEVWLAAEPHQQELGLMQVTVEELEPIPADEAAGLPQGAERGMLFVFDNEQLRSFWMLNTITALDIAYIRSDGTIVKTHTMAPLETRLYPSVEPAQYALEVRAGLLADLGIEIGDHVEIPDTVLKGRP